MLKRWNSLENNFTVNKAAAIIGVLTFISALTGFLRDRMFAAHFGAGDILDVYYAAFHIPDFIYNLLVLGTLSVAFIPVFTEWFVKDRPKAYNIANTVLNAAILIMSAACLLLLALSVQLTKLLVPGFSAAKFSQTLLLTRIFLLSPLIFTASSVFGSMLNSQKRFLMASLAPVLYNLGIIFGLVYLYPLFGLKGLGYGVILGALLHLFVQMLEALRLGWRWQAVLDLQHQAVKQIGKLFVPRIFGLDTSQISLLFGSIIGSLLSSGSIAVLNLANNLRAMPVNIFSTSIAMAVFPVMSEQYAAKDHPGFVKTLNKAINQSLFFIIPISILILIFRAYIVRLAYGAGKFSWENTIETFETLGIFTVSLFAQSLLPLLARAFYARKNTKTPVIVNLISLALNIGLSYWFAVKVLTFNFNLSTFNFSVKTGGVEGIALGFTLASVFNCLALYLILRASLAKDIPGTVSMEKSDGVLIATVTKIILSSLVMAVAGYAGIHIFVHIVNPEKALGILIQSGLSVILAIAAFLCTAKLLRLEEVKGINGYIGRVFGKH